MIKVSDYIARRMADAGIETVFMISGGGAMHLNESFGSQPGLSYLCNHHEQAAAMAVEGYSRFSGKLGCAVVTGGPGGINTMNGLFGLWADSIPGLFVSGQVKYSTTVRSTGLPLRQFGDQEAPIVDLVRPITKYAVMVTEPDSIRYHLERAMWLALNGRPGPVWLDVPINVQSALVDESSLRVYDPAEDQPAQDPAALSAAVAETLRRLRQAERPIILAGGGVRASRSFELFREIVELLNVPVQTATGAHDLMPTDHRLFAGRPGVTADRASNFNLQNSDLFLGLGTRLWIRLISYSWETFAREAFRIAVDVDAAELAKPTLKLDLPVHADLHDFLLEMRRQLGESSLPPKSKWIDWCQERRRRYPPILPEHAVDNGYVNSYHFIEVLARLAAPDETVVTGNGTANQCTFQAIPIREGQRLIGNAGCASMGYDLPAAIGACIARDRRRVVCLAGDGSLQMNIQELQTLAHHRLPVKIFVLNNDGYLAIRTTQEAYFGAHYVASGPSSGVTCPDFVKVAHAYGIPAGRVKGHAGLEQAVRTALDSPGPYLLDLVMDPKQQLLPRLSSRILPDGSMVSSPLEDLYPFLSREEYAENMIVPPWKPKT